MQITVLGSGSAGNCALIESASTMVLIDAGLSARQIALRLQKIGRNIAHVSAIILTHEHSDHTGALPTLCKNQPLAVYANRLTAEAVTGASKSNGPCRISWRLFSNGQSFTVGDFDCESFSVPHDAQDPVGFTVRHGDITVGFVTDLGHATKLVAQRLRDADVLILEANHDRKLLQDDTARPWATKQRIMSRHGHLSNDAAAALAGEVVSDRLRHVVLAHLSRDCNRPELAHRAVGEKLQRLGANRVALTVAAQDEPAETLAL